MTDETRETLTKMRDRREGIISAGFFTSREAMAAICTDCAKTHKVIVVEREAPKEHWPAAPPQEDQ